MTNESGGERLPAGRTCLDCANYERCSWLISARATWTCCDWHPSRFRERDEQCKGVREGT